MNEFKSITNRILNILLDDKLFYSYYDIGTNEIVTTRTLKFSDPENIYYKLDNLLGTSHSSIIRGISRAIGAIKYDRTNR